MSVLKFPCDKGEAAKASEYLRRIQLSLFTAKLSATIAQFVKSFLSGSPTLADQSFRSLGNP